MKISSKIRNPIYLFIIVLLVLGIINFSLLIDSKTNQAYAEEPGELCIQELVYVDGHFCWYCPVSPFSIGWGCIGCPWIHCYDD